MRHTQRSFKGGARGSFALAVFAAVSCTVLHVASAGANWKDMAARLPSQTNAIVAINIDAVMKAPLAVKERWLETWQNVYQSGPVAIIPGTQRVLAGASLKQGLQDADWHITMMELTEPVPIEDVARSQGGYTEKIQASMAVCAPSAYWMNLDSKTLGSFSPADRQSVYKWLCNMMGKGVESPHLKGLVSSLGSSTHILMALDLQEQYSPTSIRNAIEMNPLSNLDPEKIDIGKLAEALAGIQYVVLKINITDKIEATTIVQLSSSAEWLADVAKSVTTQILDRVGIELPDMENWAIKSEGKRLTMKGDMSKATLFELLGVLGMKTTTKPVEVSDDPAVIAQTSRSFYRAICAALDSYPKSGSYELVHRWVQRESQKIEYLPLVNVDPDLVAWSVEITKKMREVSMLLATDKQSASAAALSVQNPTVVGGYNGAYTGNSAGYGYGGSTGYTYNSSYGTSDAAAQAVQNAQARQNAARERMQLLRQQQAQSLKAVSGIMGDVSTGRNAVRAKMTEKYDMEF